MLVMQIWRSKSITYFGNIHEGENQEPIQDYVKFTIGMNAWEELVFT